MPNNQEIARCLRVIPLCLLLFAAGSCQRTKPVLKSVAPSPSPVVKPLPANTSPQVRQLIDSAVAQSQVTTGYDAAWVKIDYPNGDVPPETGVCSDVIVRAFRKTGIDLQKEVHEDMTRAWSAYPKKWGASGTDTSIDHRRVLNLTTFFDRGGKSLPVTQDRADYLPGDIVAWELSNGIEHIGIMTDQWSEPDKHCLVVHNIGAGARIEDVLLNWKIIGHYRYFK